MGKRRNKRTLTLVALFTDSPVIGYSRKIRKNIGRIIQQTKWIIANLLCNSHLALF